MGVQPTVFLKIWEKWEEDTKPAASPTSEMLFSEGPFLLNCITIQHEKVLPIIPNGKTIKIAAATVPAFKAGKLFKDAVNVKPKKKTAKKAKK